MSAMDETPVAMQDDLIVARATAAGPAAVAVVRVDGVGARELVGRLFRPVGRRGPLEEPRRMVLGRWFDPSNADAIDEGLTVFFPQPHSYTGNDLAEWHCHGGAVSARRLIEAALALGARPAAPGEFTRRAFLNGRIDLAQAEAVADLINAQTDAAARAAQGQLAGALSKRIGAVREDLIALAAEIEARIDFPDEEIGEADRGRLAGSFAAIERESETLLETRRRGRLLREGARVVLVGRPNAGKSSLLNALARRERAIVTPHPGTTRDTIECTIDLAGVPLVLVDTAGLRSSQDPVERIGIERARREIEQADLVVEVVDITDAETHTGDPALSSRPADLTVWNKCDLPHPAPPPGAALPVSAVRGDGLPALERALLERLLGGGWSGGEEAMAVGIRHAELLERAIASLRSASGSFAEGAYGELTMVDLRDALDALSRILGLAIGDAVLDRIFSRFCIGK